MVAEVLSSELQMHLHTVSVCDVVVFSCHFLFFSLQQQQMLDPYNTEMKMDASLKAKQAAAKQVLSYTQSI